MTQEAHQPSDAAMRFAVKWHSALGLDSFGVQILAKAYDEDVNTRTPDSVIAELVEALRPFADKAQQFSKQPDGVVTVQIDFSNFRRAANALAKLEASK